MKARLYFAWLTGSVFTQKSCALLLAHSGRPAHIRPDQVDSQKALEQAKALARAVPDKIDSR